MPEGDTVAKVADALRRGIAGRRIVRSELRVPAHATADLSGQTITEVVSRGKHLLIRTDADVTLHMHLKMDGAWRLERAGRRPRDPDDVIRVVLETDDAVAIGSRLGVVELIRTGDEKRVLGHLGPDLLGDDWDAGEALRRLRAVPERPVGEALIDQTVMAGLGNVYRSEICFLRGVHPSTPVAEVAVLDAAVVLARRLLLANRETGNQVTTGDPRPGRRHWVYGRGGEPCRRCGARIERRDGEGDERVTYWCPTCQPPLSGRTDRSRTPRSGSGSSRIRRSLPPTRSR